jgi:hypothetical protein
VSGYCVENEEEEQDEEVEVKEVEEEEEKREKTRLDTASRLMLYVAILVFEGILKRKSTHACACACACVPVSLPWLYIASPHVRHRCEPSCTNCMPQSGATKVCKENSHPSKHVGVMCACVVFLDAVVLAPIHPAGSA